MIYLKDSYTKSFEEKILLVEGDKIITQDSLFMLKVVGNPETREYLKLMIKNSMLSTQLNMS